jgi:hypothetical protein
MTGITPKKSLGPSPRGVPNGERATPGGAQR